MVAVDVYVYDAWWIRVCACMMLGVYADGGC